MNSPDIIVRNEGSVISMKPDSDAARDWAEENVAGPIAYMGPWIVGDHRPMMHLIEGAAQAGLQIEGFQPTLL